MRSLPTLADLDATRREAATMSATCPLCDRTGLKVHEQVKQATRQSPALLLCFQGYCPDCQMSVPTDVVQWVLS